MRNDFNPNARRYRRPQPWWERYHPPEWVILCGLAMMCLACSLPTF